MRTAGPVVEAAGSAAPILPPVALYIHVPFCVSLCPYCDFVVHPGAAARGPRNRIGSFVAAALTELRLRADALDEGFGPVGLIGSLRRPPLGSVYLGGGTPSLLPSEALSEILEAVRSRFGLAPDAEITLEANPGSDERGDPRAAVRAGATRISYGAQSFDRDELRRLGRRHSPGEVADAVAEARSAGVSAVNLDLLYDVPGQTEASWARSIDAALALEPDHVSMYALTIEDPAGDGLTGANGDHLPTPAGARRWRQRAIGEQDEDRAAAQYTYASDRLATAGWHGYEISNWARPGRESRHNLAYWRRLPYEAVGPGAHAFDGQTRRWNAARLDAYIAALSAGRLPPGGSESIDGATAAAEQLILGLRTSDGVPAGPAFERRYGSGLDAHFRAAIAWAIEAGLATTSTADDRIRLTVRGRLLSKEVVARLL
jgi:putative oxygen-independent coproporphyrinogen III oxidase